MTAAAYESRTPQFLPSGSRASRGIFRLKTNEVEHYLRQWAIQRMGGISQETDMPSCSTFAKDYRPDTSYFELYARVELSAHDERMISMVGECINCLRTISPEQAICLSNYYYCGERKTIAAKACGVRFETFKKHIRLAHSSIKALLDIKGV